MSEVINWPGAALFACAIVVAAISYWLGFRHGLAHVVAFGQPAPRKQITEPPFIPAYRVKELTVLMELGVLTAEEFEQEKGKLHAHRAA